VGRWRGSGRQEACPEEGRFPVLLPSVLQPHAALLFPVDEEGQGLGREWWWGDGWARRGDSGTLPPSSSFPISSSSSSTLCAPGDRLVASDTAGDPLVGATGHRVAHAGSGGVGWLGRHPRHCGNSWKWGLAPSNDPGRTWEFGRRRRRFTIMAVQRLPGWVKRVLRQIKVGLGLWQRCGGQISVAPSHQGQRLDCEGAAGVGEESSEADAGGPGPQSCARSHLGVHRGLRRFSTRAVEGPHGRAKRVLRQIKVVLGMWQS